MKKGASPPKYTLDEIAREPQFQDVAWLRERWTPGFTRSKRAIDVCISVIFIIVFAVTLPFVALAIKLDSRGPVFYIQERLGKDSIPFRVIKYRSMVQDAERHVAQFASIDDSRVTRIGQILRTTRMDELPQAINVLVGQMTVVGPRPERPHVVDEMSAIEPAFRMRTMVAPGLTGYAQVHAHYAANSDQLLEKLEYDLYYIRNASGWLDLNIMWQTVLVVFRRQGT